MATTKSLLNNSSSEALSDQEVLDSIQRIGTNTKETFPFMGIRCDRVVHGVFNRLRESANLKAATSNPESPLGQSHSHERN